MQRIGPAQQPFELSDGILAFCLYLAGIPFLTTRNRYSVETFRALGFTGEIDLCEAALQCVKENRKGDLKYLFAKSPELRALLKAFTDQEAIIKQGKGKESARDVIRELMQSFSREEISVDEALMRIACIILKLRGGFLNRWKEQTPWVVVPEPGRERKFKSSVSVQTPGGGNRNVPADGVEYPGFKVIPANASDELKKKMGLL